MSPKIRIAVAATAALGLAVPAAAVARHGHNRGGGRNQTTVRGTVASLKASTLTIAKADGTTVSARVTAATEIECQPAAMLAPTATTAERHGGGDQANGGGQSRGSDDAVAETETETEAAEAPENETTEPAGHDQGDAAEPSGATSMAAPCDQSALTLGTTVRRARIRDTASGPVFKQIELAV
jgi:hypothetical protein